MPDDKPPVEKAVELLVYAPVGMALYVRDMLPSMMGIFVARGKREVSNHRTPPPPPTPPPLPDEVRRRIDESVGIAKVVAESGFGVAKDVAGSGIGVARDVAGTALQGLLANRPGAARPDSRGPGAAEGWASPAPDPAPDHTRDHTRDATPTPAPDPVLADEAPPAPDVETLPIPDYDELSASQVVERLEGLDRDSLEAIRSYEAAHRGRNTILGKISQLS